MHWPQALVADLLALGGALWYGLYSAASKRLGGDRVLARFIAFASASALFLLTALVTRRPLWISDPPARWLALYHGVVISGIPALFWLRALAAGRTAYLAILVYLTPALGLLWLKWLVPSDAMTVWVGVGFAFIVAGFLVQWIPSVPEREHTIKKGNTA